MQPIPDTEDLIFLIKKSSDFLTELQFADENLLFYSSTQDIIEKAIKLFTEMDKTNLKFIDTEFWEVCSSLNEIQLFKKVFEVKFGFLLNWRPEFGETNAEFNSVIRKDQARFTSFLDEELSDLNKNQEKILKHYYAALNFRILMIKREIIMLFNQWDEMSPNTMAKKPTNNMPSEIKSKFRLAPKRKTDFLKILSAMYDCRMFETEDGYIANNKQELISEFGRLLSEDFTKYSVSLSQSKQVTKETFLKPFTDIRKKAEEYYDK